MRSTDNAGLVETVKELALKVRQVSSGDGGVVGNVPATLALTLGPPASFGAFTPGVARDYTALDDRDRGLLGRRRHALGGRPEHDQHGPSGQRLVRDAAGAADRGGRGRVPRRSAAASPTRS